MYDVITSTEAELCATLNTELSIHSCRSFFQLGEHSNQSFYLTGIIWSCSIFFTFIFIYSAINRFIGYCPRPSYHLFYEVIMAIDQKYQCR